MGIPIGYNVPRSLSEGGPLVIGGALLPQAIAGEQRKASKRGTVSDVGEVQKAAQAHADEQAAMPNAPRLASRDQVLVPWEYQKQPVTYRNAFGYAYQARLPGNRPTLSLISPPAEQSIPLLAQQDVQAGVVRLLNHPTDSGDRRRTGRLQAYQRAYKYFLQLKIESEATRSIPAGNTQSGTAGGR